MRKLIKHLMYGVMSVGLLASCTSKSNTFVVEGFVDEAITASAYNVYIGDENFRVSPEKPFEVVVVKDKKGIYEYILEGCQNTKLLNVRVFDEPTKKAVYAQQTALAREKGESNREFERRILKASMTSDKIWMMKDCNVTVDIDGAAVEREMNMEVKSDE